MIRRGLLLLCLTALPAAAAPLKTGVDTAPATGLPAQLRAPGRLLVAPATLLLREAGKDLPAPPLRRAEPGVWQGEVNGLAVSIRPGQSVAPWVELTIRNGGTSARSLSVGLALAVDPACDRAFFPAGDEPHRTLRPGDPPLSYSYAGGSAALAMPLAQVYAAKADLGLACFGEVGELVEPMSFRVTATREETRLEVTCPVSVPAGGSVRRRLYLAATRGDWRPALGAMLAEFPAAFKPANPEVDALHGPFVCSSGTPGEAEVGRWYDQGCRVVEVHGTFPFYGEYVPTRETWTPLVDDEWHVLKERVAPAQRPADWPAIRDAVERQKPPSMTIAKINDYVDRLHRRGMKGLIYFNPTEAWAPWAAATFAADRQMMANGQPAPAWYESSGMIPDQDRPWGRYLLDQVRGELRIYPKIDGVFFDQSAGGGHDLTRLCAEGARIVRARGGICWWNGPYNLELAALADGMMTEGGGTDTYRAMTEIIQYYGLAGKPIVSLGPANVRAYAELLSHGVVPQPVGPASAEVGERWFPLFRWLRNRTWVLEAHALDPVPGVSANLYRVPGGNAVVTLVPAPLPDDDRTQSFDLPVTVRLADAAQVRGVYLLAPELTGYHTLAFTRQGETLQVNVPRLGPAAVLVLARTGVFAALTGPLHRVAGDSRPAGWVVDNWTTEPRAVAVTLGDVKLETRVPAGRSVATEVPLKVPAGAAERRCGFAVAGEVAGAELPRRAELAIDPPLLLSLTAPAEVRDDEPFAAGLDLLSHLPAGTKLALGTEAKTARLELPGQVVPAADRRLHLDLMGRPTAAGDATLVVTATPPGGEPVRATAPLRVLATAISPVGLTKLRGGELQMDVFGVDVGPYAHKPVSLNGVVLGDLPQGGGDHWTTVSLPLPKAAFAAVREHNAITIDNQVADAFKVRRLRLIVRLRGGVIAVSSTDPGVYTGWTDWSYGEGKQFAAGQPLTGMSVDLKLDPNRQERYEEFFGTPRSGKLVLEVNGADAGRYAHKAVSLNGQPLGDLPPAADWKFVELPLTADALDTLAVRNELRIENSTPPDAFKVRRARLELENTEGRRFVSETNPLPYTSVGWEFAEGTVGSPMVIPIGFTQP